MVAPVDKHAVDPSEKIRLIAAEQVGLERVDHAANAGITIIILAGAISVAQRLYLIRLEPEDEDILRTNLFPDLDVGAVQVPMVSAPLSANFMLPVPDASVPAVEICSLRSAAGMIFSASETR